MRTLIWLLIIVLILVHQDFWYWNDSTLVFGFFPIGLLYHVGISLGATLLWYLATVFCWPNDLIEAAESDSTTEAPQ